MAIIKSTEARELDENALLSKLAQINEEFLRERGQVATGGRSSNPGRIRELRRSRARIITILHEKALGIKKNVKPKVKAGGAKAQEKESKKDAEKESKKDAEKESKKDAEKESKEKMPEKEIPQAKKSNADAVENEIKKQKE